MHHIEPFYNWRHLYLATEDEHSPFFGLEYSEFEFSNTIYNYYIHPQWDDIGSRTLYLKVLFVEYEQKFAVVELIGEWNDAIENDIMQLKRNLIDSMLEKGISKYILIVENVLNFHSSDDDYYAEWGEDVKSEGGWIALLNLPQYLEEEVKTANLYRYLFVIMQVNWRIYHPQHLFQFVDNNIIKRVE